MLKVHVSSQQNVLPVSRRRLTNLLRLAAPPEWDDAEVSLVLVDGAQMEALNRRYAHRRGGTDVLAFPLEDETAGRDRSRGAAAPPRMMGEVVVCASLARDEAAARNVSAQDELALYALHGALHLLGYDDHTPAGRREMYAREAELLQSAGFRSVRRSPRRLAPRREVPHLRSAARGGERGG